MLDEVGCHAKTGRIADAKAAAQSGFEADGRIRGTHAGKMLDEIGGEGADQPDGQHLGAEGPAQLRPIGDAGAVGDAELAVAIDRGGAHEIPRGFERCGVGLTAGRQCRNDIVEEANAAIGAREDKFAVETAAGLLLGHVLREARDVSVRRHAIKERERRVPRLGDHTIAAQVSRESWANATRL